MSTRPRDQSKLARSLSVLAHIPAAPRKITAPALCKRLAADGIEVGLRTVQRDLHQLAASFEITCDDAKPAGWGWAAGRRVLELPGMEVETALTLQLVRKFLVPLLPRAALQRLEPHMQRAGQVLSLHAQTAAARWQDKIAVISSGAPLLLPEVHPAVLEVVYDALLTERVFAADYRGLAQSAWRRHRVHPQGLIHYDGVLYLAALLDDYTDVRQLAVHRMRRTVLGDTPARRAPGFDLARYVAQEHPMQFPTGRRIALTMEVVAWLARHLEERKLAVDQTIEPAAQKNWFRVRATVDERDQLDWWLRGLGRNVRKIQKRYVRRR